MDTITPEMRSKVMSAIHSRDTLPEMRVRKIVGWLGKWLSSSSEEWMNCDWEVEGTVRARTG